MDHHPMRDRVGSATGFSSRLEHMRYLHRIRTLVWRPPEVLDRGSAEWVDSALVFTPRMFDLHPTLERFEHPIFDEKCHEGLRASMPDMNAQSPYLEMHPSVHVVMCLLIPATIRWLLYDDRYYLEDYSTITPEHFTTSNVLTRVGVFNAVSQDDCIAGHETPQNALYLPFELWVMIFKFIDPDRELHGMVPDTRISLRRTAYRFRPLIALNGDLDWLVTGYLSPIIRVLETHGDMRILHTCDDIKVLAEETPGAGPLSIDPDLTSRILQMHPEEVEKINALSITWTGWRGLRLSNASDDTSTGNAQELTRKMMGRLTKLTRLSLWQQIKDPNAEEDPEEDAMMTRTLALPFLSREYECQLHTLVTPWNYFDKAHEEPAITKAPSLESPSSSTEEKNVVVPLPCLRDTLRVLRLDLRPPHVGVQKPSPERLASYCTTYHITHLYLNHATYSMAQEALRSCGERLVSVAMKFPIPRNDGPGDRWALCPYPTYFLARSDRLPALRYFEVAEDQDVEYADPPRMDVDVTSSGLDPSATAIQCPSLSMILWIVRSTSSVRRRIIDENAEKIRKYTEELFDFHPTLQGVLCPRLEAGPEESGLLLDYYVRRPLNHHTGDEGKVDEGQCSLYRAKKDVSAKDINEWWRVSSNWEPKPDMFRHRPDMHGDLQPEDEEWAQDLEALESVNGDDPVE
ncbi:hypothetical protein C8Q74DRAFT_1217535 [Fomes fomentarius]|nr:hypothetical protein C8Q74DRAFT_1217535 [Fomes fomentarius]